MKTISDVIGSPKNIEVSILTIIALYNSVIDNSLLELKSNLESVWNLELDPYMFNLTRESIIKYVLSCIILVRTFTLHINLACLVVMLWPAVLEDKPSLFLPWLTIGFIRCLITDVMGFFVGFYFFCSYSIVSFATVTFVVDQIVEHGPAFYMWFCVYDYYKELSKYVLKICSSRIGPFVDRRKRLRSMWRQRALFKELADDGRNLISESTISTLLHPLQKQLSLGQSRSVDTLLLLKAAEEEKEEIMRTSVTDANNTTEKNTSKPKAPELVMQFLNISDQDIEQAINEKNSRADVDFDLETLYNVGAVLKYSSRSSESFLSKSSKLRLVCDLLRKSSIASSTQSNSSRGNDNDNIEQIEQLITENTFTEYNKGQPNVDTSPSSSSLQITESKQSNNIEVERVHSFIVPVPSSPPIRWSSISTQPIECYNTKCKYNQNKKPTKCPCHFNKKNDSCKNNETANSQQLTSILRTTASILKHPTTCCKKNLNKDGKTYVPGEKHINFDTKVYHQNIETISKNTDQGTSTKNLRKKSSKVKKKAR